jgi:hypothetical protein
MRHVVLSVLAVGLIATGAHARSVDLPEREEFRQTYELPPTATVEITGIGGPVEVETSNSSTADVTIVRSAETREDLACAKVAVDASPSHLRIRFEPLCMNVRGQQRVQLVLPNRADIRMSSIAGDVRVAPTQGMIRLDSIAGRLVLEGVSAARISSLAGGVRMEVTDLRDRGIRLDSVTGGVDIGVRAGLNADLSVSSIIGEVDSDLPDVRVFRNGDADFRASIGSGGRPIEISSIVGGVKLRRSR